MKSNIVIVISIKDSGSVCTFSIKNGIISTLSSGGCDPAYVCKRAGAVLTGTTDEILASVESAFNRDQCTVEDDLYRAELVESFEATIYEAGNGLPGFGDTVLADDEFYTIVTPDEHLRISTNGPGQGNSIEATLVAVGNQCDLSDEEWDAVHDGSVVLH
jgi:hypothetical protein